MEIDVKSNQTRNPENNPGGNGGEEEEAQQTHPNRSNLVQSAHKSVRVTECEQRSDHEAHRQNAEEQFDPESARCSALRRRESPSLIDIEMGQSQNALNNRNKHY